jgi:hypothetical protein
LAEATLAASSNELQRLGQLVGGDAVILVGGRGAASYRSALEAAGARYLPDYFSLREALESVRSP